MLEISDPRAMRDWSRATRAAGRQVGFVPTMGFLHEGHLRLVDRARREADVVVLSVFVNPLQFGPQEDLARYPRDLARDRRLAAERGVECFFVPGELDMYPRRPAIRIEPGAPAAHLCGPFRPGHFAGVLTVVAKLFHMTEPDVAVFGRKDAQQARLIQRMVDELDFPMRIVVAPTVREADGLALSSRNTYLTPPQRQLAVSLSRALDAAHQAFRRGERSAQRIVAAARVVLAAAHDIRVEYVEAVDPDALAPAEIAEADTLLALAARVGETRLIDNIILGQGLGGDERLPPGTA